MSIKLGDEVRDKLSGLTGTVVCRTEWLYGCIRLGVQPSGFKDGKPIESTYFDEAQLDPIDKEEAAGESASQPPGGPSREGPSTEERR